MYILRIVSANRQLSEAEFHQLFDNAKFKYTGGGLGDFEATVGKFTCTIDVAHPKNDRANVKTLTTLQSIIDYGKKYRGYSLRVTHADRNFGWSYTNREEGNYEFEIPSNVNPPGMTVPIGVFMG